MLEIKMNLTCSYLPFLIKLFMFLNVYVWRPPIRTFDSISCCWLWIRTSRTVDIEWSNMLYFQKKILWTSDMFIISSLNISIACSVQWGLKSNTWTYVFSLFYKDLTDHCMVKSCRKWLINTWLLISPDHVLLPVLDRMKLKTTMGMKMKIPSWNLSNSNSG